MKRLLLTLVIFAGSQAGAQTFTMLYSFTGGADGNMPSGGLVADANGNLYGATFNGGGGTLCPANSQGCGTIFELTPNNGQWTETVLYRFTGGKDGAWPNGNLVLDAAGNIYGTTMFGGSGRGVVFELSPSANGWTETVLKVFWGKNGSLPMAGLVMDTAGNLYGSTTKGGLSTTCEVDGCGTVFELQPSAGAWKFTTIYEMTSLASWPDGPLILDAKGSLYGTTMAGSGRKGLNGQGVVFRMSLVNGKWVHGFLHIFAYPWAESTGGLTLDAAGNLYGSAYSRAAGHGACVYELVPSGITWKFAALNTFPVKDGAPDSGAARDSSGNLYGITDFGGVGYGTVFKLASSTWEYFDLYSFDSSGQPNGNLLVDSSGNLYGVTESTGDGFGSVYEIQP